MNLAIQQGDVSLEDFCYNKGKLTGEVDLKKLA